ncbi:hypothetical protein cypCar_00029258 [Cyprinus carpio]|nr:hypothetical protein cypCar_00029258 [Cyprinus carpio]
MLKWRRMRSLTPAG